MAINLLKISALAYGIAILLVFVHIGRSSETGGRRVNSAIMAALLVHALALGGRIVELSAFPLADAHDALSLFGFLSLIISLVVAGRGGVPQVVWFATPLVGVMVIVASGMDSVSTAPESLKSVWLSLHIGLALLGDSAFVVAGLTAVVYLIQEKRLKRKKRKKGKSGKGRRRSNDHLKAKTGLNALPALEALDRVNVWIFKFGFPLMTLGIITGVFYGKEHTGRYWTWDARNTVSAAVWMTYAAMLYARLVIGWRGRKAAWLTIACVLAILMTFMALGVSGTTMHGQDG